MPALAVALYLPVFDELGHHAVQVVGLDLQRLGDLRDRDAGLVAHQLERLVGPCIATSAAAGASGATGRLTPARACAVGGARAPGAATSAQQCRACGLQTGDLLLQLAQAA